MLEEATLVYAFFNIGAQELLVIFAILLLLFGGKKLPEVARSMGQAVRAFRDEASKLKREVELEAEKEAAQAQLKGQATPTSTPTTQRESTLEDLTGKSPKQKQQ